MVLSHCRPTWLADFGLIACSLPWSANASEPPARIPLTFDTDIGNDVDDALALGVTPALRARGRCELLAVTITKGHELAAPFFDAINTFYGRGEVPIGTVRDGVAPAPGGGWARRKPPAGMGFGTVGTWKRGRPKMPCGGT